jgi:hypothetical protein
VDALTSLPVTAGAPSTAPELEPGDASSAVAFLSAGRFLALIVADLDRQHVLRLAQALEQRLFRHLA